MRVIRENSSTRLKSALFGDVTGKIRTFGIITPENPMSKETSSEENNKFHVAFKKLIGQMHIQYIKQLGSFGNKEHSYVLVNVSLKDMVYLGNKFHQQSFFFGKVTQDGSEISYYERSGEDSDYKLIETSKKVINAKDFDDFFSHHGDFKYSIDLDYFKEGFNSMPNVVDEEALDEALDDSYTMKYRIGRRALAYNGKGRK